MERKSLPESINQEMKMWRAGLSGMPQPYISFHQDLANERLSELEGQGCIVHSKKMVGDGWFDGMQVMQVVLETPSGILKKIKWLDSNQGFLEEVSPSGGWTSVNTWE